MKRFFIAAALLAGASLLAGAQDFEGKKIPAEFTIDLNFAEGNNPFTTPCTAYKKQVPEGETYICTFGKGARACNARFVICKGPNDNGYSFGSQKSAFLDFRRPKEQPENCGYIRIPAVPGRYLKSIEVTIGTKSATIFLCKDAEKTKKGEGLVAKFQVPDNGTFTKDFTPGETAVNTAYYIYRNSSSAFRVVDLKLTYATPKKGNK